MCNFVIIRLRDDGKGGDMMSAVNVKIEPEIINWALSQTKEEKLGENMMSNISHWLKGTKTPTFRQIEDLSKKTNIPLGYFFLETPPVEEIKLLEYRTVGSIQVDNPSRNLIDKIYEMERIQDWMKEYRRDRGFDVSTIVGSTKGIRNIGVIVERIRRDLELKEIWHNECRDVPDAFNYIRKKLEECGIIVMMSGVVGSNTHRALDINEFRAFAMIDDWAPLIFINSVDSIRARLFSLFHEAVHIWMGEDDFYNDRVSDLESLRETEKICNEVAGELIAPKQEFLRMWNNLLGENEVPFIITELAKRFHSSEIVIARKALDNKKISQKSYYEIVEKTMEQYKQLKEKKKNSGGNYYNTMSSRLDSNFVRALCESISIGRTSYTEAYRLTNTSRKTFSEVTQTLGGVEW